MKAIILLPLLIFITEISHGQVFQNLNFEDTCDTSKTSFCHWNVAWASDKVVFKPDNTESKAILIESMNPQGIGFIQQSALIINNNSNRILSFSGKIKTDSLTGKGASLNITVEDKEGNNLFTDNMFNAEVVGTKPWQEFTLKVVCSDRAYKVKIGAILYGKGKAWFDDFNIVADSIGTEPGKKEIKYINRVYRIASRHSLMRDSVDLIYIKNEALKIAGNSSDYFLCHLATEYFIKSLEDHHSLLLKPSDLKIWNNEDEDAKIDYVQYRIIDSCAYLMIPKFFSLSKKLALSYADSINKAISYLSQFNIKGWVIDLRLNLGGNMHPMIAGLGPLFDSELLGYFINVKGKKETWSYKNGSCYVEGSKVCTVKKPVVLTSHLPIAVLVGNGTGSSGEFTAMSFVGNKNTKLFGQQTFGATTGNDQYVLDDGALLLLTTTIGADRNGKLYGGPIIPDVITKEIKGQDNTLYTATDWIKTQQ